MSLNQDQFMNYNRGKDSYDLRNKQGEPVYDMALPNIYTFGSLVMGAANTYLHRHSDEARRHSRENAIAMRRDPFLMGLLEERVRSITAKKWHLEPDNPKDLLQKTVADACTKIIRNIPRVRRLQANLAEGALWYGLTLQQLDWEYKRIQVPMIQMGGPAGNGVMMGQPTIELQPIRCLTVRRHERINGDKIDFHLDGTPYILVNPVQSFPNAETVMTTEGGLGLLLRGSWRQRFIFHNHSPDDMDFFDGDMASGIHGVGIRSRIYWLDFMRRDYISWWTESLERFGLGLICVYYDRSNPKSKTEAEEIVRNYSREKSVLMMPRDFEGRHSDGVQIVEMPVAGIELLMRLKKEIENVIERYIVGQSKSSGGDEEGEGIGNTGEHQFAQLTKHDITIEDCEELAESLTGSDREPSLVNQIFKFTFMKKYGFDFPCPRWVYDVEEIDVKGRMDSIKMAMEMGAVFKAETVYNLVGEPKPEAGDDTLPPPAPAAPAGGSDGTREKNGQFGSNAGPEQEPQSPDDHTFTPADEATAQAAWGGAPMQMERGGLGLVQYDASDLQLFNLERGWLIQYDAGEMSHETLRAGFAVHEPTWKPEEHAMMAKHLHEARRLADAPLNHHTAGMAASFVKGIHENPNIMHWHMQGLADAIGVPTRGKSRQAIANGIGQHIQDRAISKFQEGNENWQHEWTQGLEKETPQGMPQNAQGPNSRSIWKHKSTGSRIMFHNWQRPEAHHGSEESPWVDTGFRHEEQGEGGPPQEGNAPLSSHYADKTMGWHTPNAEIYNSAKGKGNLEPFVSKQFANIPEGKSKFTIDPGQAEDHLKPKAIPDVAPEAMTKDSMRRGFEHHYPNWQPGEHDKMADYLDRARTIADAPLSKETAAAAVPFLKELHTDKSVSYKHMQGLAMAVGVEKVAGQTRKQLAVEVGAKMRDRAAEMAGKVSTKPYAQYSWLGDVKPKGSINDPEKIEAIAGKLKGIEGVSLTEKDGAQMRASYRAIQTKYKEKTPGRLADLASSLLTDLQGLHKDEHAAAGKIKTKLSSISWMMDQAKQSSSVQAEQQRKAALGTASKNMERIGIYERASGVPWTHVLLNGLESTHSEVTKDMPASERLRNLQAGKFDGPRMDKLLSMIDNTGYPTMTQDQLKAMAPQMRLHSRHESPENAMVHKIELGAQMDAPTSKSTSTIHQSNESLRRHLTSHPVEEIRDAHSQARKAIESNITDQPTRDHYEHAINSVLANAPERHLASLMAQRPKFTFAKDQAEVAAIMKSKGFDVPNTKEMAALVSSGGGLEFVMDGHKDQSTHEVYSHEMGHGVDGGLKKTFSSTPEWQKVTAKEGKGISEYAGKAPKELAAEESFAEFYRKANSGAEDRGKLKKDHPEAYKFFEAKGLFGNLKATAPPVAEVFEERAVAKDGNHADIKKPTLASSVKNFSLKATQYGRESESEEGPVQYQAGWAAPLPTQEEFASLLGNAQKHDNQGINSTFVFEHNGRKVFAKGPPNAEALHAAHPHQTSEIEGLVNSYPGQVANEVAISKIRALMGRAPHPVEERTGPSGEQYTIQPGLPGKAWNDFLKDAGGDEWKARLEYNRVASTVPEDQLGEIAFFNHVNKLTDRHRGNALLFPGGAHDIDHGFSLGPWSKATVKMWRGQQDGLLSGAGYDQSKDPGNLPVSEKILKTTMANWPKIEEVYRQHVFPRHAQEEETPSNVFHHANRVNEHLDQIHEEIQNALKKPGNATMRDFGGQNSGFKSDNKGMINQRPWHAPVDQEASTGSHLNLEMPKSSASAEKKWIRGAFKSDSGPTPSPDFGT